MGLIRRLRRDRRGNTIVIFAAGLPMVIGAAGLATDTIQWVTWKRQLQRAADSAAMAGVYARVQGASTADTAVAADLVQNNKTGIALLSGYPQIAYPTSSSYTHGVRVQLALRKKLPFSSLFMSQGPLISTDATAGLTNDGNFCVVALDDSTASSVTIGGSATVSLGCGVISMSRSTSSSVGTNGNAYTLGASPVAGVGGLPSTIRGASNLQPYHTALPDPYAGKYSTDVPASGCKANIGAGTVNGVVQPGCYNNFNPGNGTTTLASGVYILNNTSLSINGNTNITGTGVTLIFAGTAPGTLTMNGNSTISLTAPTTGDYAKMLIIQSPNATEGNSNKINGNNGSNFDGAIYFPKGVLNFTGSSSPATKCAMIVAFRVDFGGNTDIQNNTTGCTGNTTVPGKKVRLVA